MKIQHGKLLGNSSEVAEHAIRPGWAGTLRAQGGASREQQLCRVRQRLLSQPRGRCERLWESESKGGDFPSHHLGLLGQTSLRDALTKAEVFGRPTSLLRGHQARVNGSSGRSVSSHRSWGPRQLFGNTFDSRAFLPPDPPSLVANPPSGDRANAGGCTEGEESWGGAAAAHCRFTADGGAGRTRVRRQPVRAEAGGRPGGGCG